MRSVSILAVGLFTVPVAVNVRNGAFASMMEGGIVALSLLPSAFATSSINGLICATVNGVCDEICTVIAAFEAGTSRLPKPVTAMPSASEPV